MTPPYARATASSASKASPKSPKATSHIEPVQTTLPFRPKTSDGSPGNPKTPTSPTANASTESNDASPSSQDSKKKALKRPSLLTSDQKHAMTYKRDLYHIVPKDASKPCPLSKLPSELRTQIYTYVFPESHTTGPSWPNVTKPKHVTHPLLHTSRAIRIEAAYTYYTTTRFQFTVRNANFAPIIRWVETLPAPHRSLLSKNPGLEINFTPTIKGTHTYPPKGWLLDNDMEHHWRACQPFGNIYTVPSEADKLHFLIFCRLAEWWRWVARPANREIKVQYTFQQSAIMNNWGIPDLFEECACREFLDKHGRVVAMKCVDKAWERNRDASRAMKSEALRFFDMLDKWYYRRMSDCQPPDHAWSNIWLKEIRDAIEKW